MSLFGGCVDGRNVFDIIALVFSISAVIWMIMGFGSDTSSMKRGVG